MLIKNNIRYIKNADSNIGIIRLVYPYKLKKTDNKEMLQVIANIICTCTNEFKDYKDFNNHLKELSILNLDFRYRFYFDTLIMYFDLEIPNKNVYDKFNLEEAFKFLVDVITNPFVENDKFDIDKFHYELDYLYEKHLSLNNKFYYRCSRKVMNFIDPENKLELDYDYILKQLKKITNKNLYSFYKKAILNNDFLVFSFGNYDNTDIEPLFNKYFPFEEKKVKVNRKDIIPFEFNSNESLCDTNESNQSIYYIAYKVNDFNKQDVHYFDLLISYINSKQEGSLFDELRVKNSLIYDVNYRLFTRRGFFILELDISDKNKNKVDEMLPLYWEKLKDKELLKNINEKEIKKLEIDLLYDMDSDFFNLDFTLNKTFKFDNLKDIIKFHKELDVDKFYDFICRIEKTKSVYLRGEEDE